MIRLLLIASLLLPAMRSTAQVKHVVLISVDSFRPDFYKDPSWDAPNLRKLMQAGVYADGVNSVFPSVTYPSHTTLVTGALPGRHGVYFNRPFLSEKGRWYWEESYIRTETLWDAVRKAGMTSAAVMWPVSVGAPIDYNFPVIRADKGDTTSQLAVTAPHVTPEDLLTHMQGSFGKSGKNAFDNSGPLDITIGKMARYMIRTYKPNLTAIHFITVDHQQHVYGREAAEVKTAVHMVDSLIGTVLKAVEEAGMLSSTAFIITGDHGMVDVKTTVSPNVWLAEHGLITDRGWKARFHTTGGSAFLYLKNKQDHETSEQVVRILAALPPEEKKLFHILDRKALDSAGANPEAALALTMTKGVAANGSTKGPAVNTNSKPRGVHGYFPDFPEIQTGFIAAGSGIVRGKAVKEMGIQDVAPLISRLLNLDLQVPDGVLIPGILQN